MICLKSKLAVKMSNFDPLIFVLSLTYHELDFASKFPKATVIYGVFFQSYD